MARPGSASAIVLATLLLLGGCASSASQLLTLPEDTLAQRRLQSRRYDTPDEERVLTACTGQLQDMGFQIDEVSPRLGVLLASKMRESNPLKAEARLAVVVLSIGVLTALAESRPQKIEVGIVTRPAGAGEERTIVRAIFRRTLHGPNGQPSLATETITDPEIYQQFFDRLSKALSLEARES